MRNVRGLPLEWRFWPERDADGRLQIERLPPPDFNIPAVLASLAKALPYLPDHIDGEFDSALSVVRRLLESPPPTSEPIPASDQLREAVSELRKTGVGFTRFAKAISHVEALFSAQLGEIERLRGIEAGIAAALKATNIVGIYDEFTSVPDAIEQMALWIKEQESELGLFTDKGNTK